jgi:hypothetical protein
MPVRVFSNTIGNKDHGQLVEKAVLEEIGDRAGDWLVHLTEPQMSPEWGIEIDGPNGFKWSRSFCGIEEQDEKADFIRAVVRRALS